MPPWALAVAETHPRGLTGRVGAGQRPGLPRDEARFSSRRLGRNPPSGTQSLDKTPLGNRMVARSEKNWRVSAAGAWSGVTSRETARRIAPGTDCQWVGAERRKLAANGAADAWGDAVNSTAAKAMSPR